MAKTYAVLFGAQAITVQLYPGRDRFEFYQGHHNIAVPWDMMVTRILRELDSEASTSGSFSFRVSLMFHIDGRIAHCIAHKLFPNLL